MLAERLSPRGDYQLLDDFTERVDTDVSNDAGMLGLPGPPRSFGLYRDGNRIASLPRPGPVDVGYAGAALDALPYRLIARRARAAGRRAGGFRIAEVLALGAAQVTVVEPEPVLLRALRHGLGPSRPRWRRPTRASTSPRAAPWPRCGRDQRYDLIDISADFLDAAEANATAFSVEALAADLAPWRRTDWCRSRSRSAISRSTRRMLATARAALLAAGIADPAAHVVVYRSAWNVRILLSRAPWDAARIAALPPLLRRPVVRRVVVSRHRRRGRARASIYNDLPAVSFAEGEDGLRPVPTTPSPTRPARCWPASPALRARPSTCAPITLDRPFFYAVLRLDQLGTLLRRLEVLPQAEIGGAGEPGGAGAGGGDRRAGAAGPRPGRRAGIRDRTVGVLRPIVYFPALALGFLFIEIYLIEPGQLVAERPHQRVRPGADRHAGVLRPGQHAGRPARPRTRPGRRRGRRWSC